MGLQCETNTNHRKFTKHFELDDLDPFSDPEVEQDVARMFRRTSRYCQGSLEAHYQMCWNVDGNIQGSTIMLKKEKTSRESLFEDYFTVLCKIFRCEIKSDERL